MDSNQGTLYIVSTPIGNLEDITLRALRILKEVGLIAAEDTRQTQKLLNHYGIHNPLTSYHDHNKEEKTEVLLQRLKEGGSVALVCDAGTPLISDPGLYLIKRCIQEDISMVPIPGASASVCALSVAGLPTDAFLFEGFLPRKRGKRLKTLESLKTLPHTLIFFESPYRVAQTLKDCLEVLGDRPMVLARELTKVFEELIRGRITEVIEKISKKRVKGEVTFLIEGARNKRE
jgi:16S rRNA (cytidine1402-2'-O)-methyltransferase